jgi:hypothetical protein
MPKIEDFYISNNSKSSYMKDDEIKKKPLHKMNS